MKPILIARLLPNVLAVASQAAVWADGKPLVPANSQLFQLAHTEKPTFCSFAVAVKIGFVCLVDTDADGVLDMAVRARPEPGVPLTMQIDATTMAALQSPVRYVIVPRETCSCGMEILLVSLGQKNFAGHDAEFQILVFSGDDFSRSEFIKLDTDALPATLDILGAKFTNLRKQGKDLNFDLTSGFDRRPFDASFHQGWLQWAP